MGPQKPTSNRIAVNEMANGIFSAPANDRLDFQVAMETVCCPA
jgi:hypothetical protein